MSNVTHLEPSSPKRVLIVEDDPMAQPILSAIFRRLDPAIELDFTNSAEEALTRLAPKEGVDGYTMVLSDVSLAGQKSGFDLVHDCNERHIRAPFVISSASVENRSILPFIQKPYRFRDVERRVAPLLDLAIDAVPIDQAWEDAAAQLHKDIAPITGWLASMGALWLCGWVLLEVGNVMQHLPLNPWPTTARGSSDALSSIEIASTRIDSLHYSKPNTHRRRAARTLPKNY